MANHMAESHGFRHDHGFEERHHGRHRRRHRHGRDRDHRFDHDDRHRDHWPEPHWEPGAVDLAMCRPAPLIGTALMEWALYKQRLWDFKCRFMQAALFWPGERWAFEHEPWHHEWHPEPDHDDDCGEDEHCDDDRCEEPKCHPCHPCRPRCEPEHCCERRDTTNISIHARPGDVLNKTILLENNSPREVTVTPEADHWVDAEGGTSATSIVITPAVQSLAPNEAKEFKLSISVNVPPLKGGRAYFTRIRLTGCSAEPVSVALHVEPETRIDAFALVDRCRPSRSGFVEFCEQDEKPCRRERADCCGKRCRRCDHDCDDRRRCERVWLPPTRGRCH